MEGLLKLWPRLSSFGGTLETVEMEQVPLAVKRMCNPSFIQSVRLLSISFHGEIYALQKNLAQNFNRDGWMARLICKKKIVKELFKNCIILLKVIKGHQNY